MTTTPANIGSKVGRGRRSFGQLWQVPMFLIGLFALIGVAGSTPWRHTPQEREFERLLRDLRVGLDTGDRGDAVAAAAEEVKLRMRGYPAQAAEAHFLIGSAYYRQAQEKPAGPAKEIWARAAQQLERARAAGNGLAEEDKAKLQYRLGFSLYMQKKDVTRALELMALSVEKGAEQPVAGYQILADAYPRQSPPNVDGALAAARRVLDLTPAGNADALARVRLQLGELLLRKGQKAEAIQELERVGARAAPEARVKARLLQASACEETGQWTDAVAIWRKLLDDADLVAGGKARILYSLGGCYRKMEPANDAEAIRAWAEALGLGGPAGQAAGLRLGQLRLSMSSSDPDQALADWKAALENVNSPQDFRNPYITLSEVRAWLTQAVRHFQEEQEPKRTQAVAELLPKVMPGAEADLQIAQAAETLARQLDEKLRLKVDAVKPADVHRQYRRAGAAFENAAKARPEVQRAQPLWRAAQCYLKAQDAPRAQKMLQEFVHLETDEARLSEGWFTLGNLYRDAGQKDGAATAFSKCIEVGPTSFANQARYFLAADLVDQQKYDKARDILEQILRNPIRDSVDRPTQEKALYKMASLLMLMKQYNEAHVRLRECILNFRENPNVLLAREQFGECCRRLAEIQAKHELDKQRIITPKLEEGIREVVEAQIRGHRKKRKELLTEAINTFRELADDLEARARKAPLGDVEQILLRRASFDVGECFFDAEEWVEAERVFENVQRKHRRSVESFFACFRLVALTQYIPAPRQAGDLDMRAKALQSLQLLMEDLQAMPADHAVFRMPGVYTRDELLRWVEKTRRDLTAPPRGDGPLPAIR